MKPNLFSRLQPGKGMVVLFLVAFLFFGFLWLLDYPKPMIDDLCYTGAALNLASGGDFSNPFLARYFPSEHYYFIYPPVHSYTLAAWLKIFGISAAAATGFQVTTYFLMSVAVIAILKRNGAPTWLGALVPLIAAGNFLGNGLRTEALATALTWCGFALIECGVRRAPAVFFAFLLMFLSGATAPRNVVFDVALILLAGLRLWQSSAPNPKSRWRLALLVCAAFALAVLAFLLMIHFKVGEFWTAFHLHAQTVAYKKTDHLGLTHKIFLAGAVVMVIFGWRYRASHFVQIALAIGAALAMAIVTQTLAFGLGGWHVMLLALFLCAELPRRFSPAIGWAGAAVFSLFLLWRNLPTMIEIYGTLSGHIVKDRGEYYETAKTLASTPGQQLFLDPLVARYTFDYRTPKGSIDFSFSVPFPRVGTVMPILLPGAKPDDTYLLSPRFRAYVERSTYLEALPRERWTLLGSSFDRYPRKIYIIRAAECKGMKSENERPFP